MHTNFNFETFDKEVKLINQKRKLYDKLTNQKIDLNLQYNSDLNKLKLNYEKASKRLQDKLENLNAELNSIYANSKQINKTTNSSPCGDGLVNTSSDIS
ncbi:MAG: hypothetical protein ACOCM0_06415 [Campylobacter hyointestinalis]|uniref:hypothetical protein n=1 Tax=Campylobacter hyointestinalis TaxID=198 RepID=UPI0011ABF52B|nr:hypothetical protein [Campylobacter hyointestinalis]TWO30362.1 hypothetical protein YZ79_03275 [Campylobacter hyointestinalis]